MLARICRTAAIVGGCLLGVVGVLAHPVSVLIRCLAALLLLWRRRRTGPPAAPAVPAGHLDAGAGLPCCFPAGVALPPGMAATDAARLVSTSQLCAAWQRSFWLLRDLPLGPARSEVVDLRGALLDEFERRDPTAMPNGSRPIRARVAIPAPT